MLIRTRHRVPSSEITPEAIYVNRRQFMRRGDCAPGPARRWRRPARRSSGTPRRRPAAADRQRSQEPAQHQREAQLASRTSPATTTSTSSAPTRTTRRATRGTLQAAAVDGDGRRRRSRKPGDFDARRPPASCVPLEERIYRLRCVEAWSMVIPWVGFPLADLLKRVEPTSKAKYVAFATLLDPKQMPGQRDARCSTGRTSRACASTRRCTR